MTVVVLFFIILLNGLVDKYYKIFQIREILDWKGEDGIIIWIVVVVNLVNLRYYFLNQKYLKKNFGKKVGYKINI